MSSEPALSAALDVEPILDVLPVPMILVEPGSARMLYANAAAHRLAGGALTLGVPAEEYPRAYRLYDASGRALGPDEMPAVRAARGEVAQPRPGRLGHAGRAPHRARVRLDDRARRRAPRSPW